MDFLSVLPLLVLGWLAMTVLISFLSGWRMLAGYFGSNEPLAGEVYLFRSGALRRRWVPPIHYGMCLAVTVGKEAFALSPLLPLMMLHRRLVIPWSAVRACNRRGLVFRHVWLDLNEPDVRVRLDGNLCEVVQAAYERAEAGRVPANR